MTNKIILTDVDSCLLDWFAGFDNWMISQGYVVNRNSHMYSLEDRYDRGLTKDNINSLIQEFNESTMFGELPPMLDSVENVRKLVADGFRFIAVTSMGVDDVAVARRYKNLRNVFGDIFDEIHCIPLNTSKHATLQQWEGSGLFWIEDKLENALCGSELGLKAILLSQPYNKNHGYSQLYTVDDWAEIYNIISYAHAEVTNAN
jgi:FMN phosphatase YigB (HAD superfamily)